MRTLSAQSILTSHSPYVLEEFGPEETVILARSDEGVLSQAKIAMPDSVKHKRYRARRALSSARTSLCQSTNEP